MQTIKNNIEYYYKVYNANNLQNYNCGIIQGLNISLFKNKSNFNKYSDDDVKLLENDIEFMMFFWRLVRKCSTKQTLTTNEFHNIVTDLEKSWKIKKRKY